MFNPVSTYRLQFHAGFTFLQFQQIIPYLQKLGVKTIYASPVFKAVPGSMHGYDGLNPMEINPEIGTIDELRLIIRELREREMYWLQDIVPNHMAFHPGNEWLMDVMEKGRLSLYADFFDIGWNNETDGARLMVPFLGTPIEDAIVNREIRLACKDNRLCLAYNDDAYPLKLSSWLSVLQDAELPAWMQGLLEEARAISILEEPALLAERWTKWITDFATGINEDNSRRWLDDRLNSFNEDPGQLSLLAGQQHYHLCFWQETDSRINYRRFFTVNGLICLNIQQQSVFNRCHAFIRSLMEENLFQGLRVDHIDGLYNPHEYLQRLRSLAGNEKFIVVEKILAPGEQLPSEWPVQGTTGYDFLALLTNLFTREKNEEKFTAFYDSTCGGNEDLELQVRKKKACILYEHMAGELENLYRLFLDSKLAEADQLDKLEPGTLKKAIGEILVHCPVYRYYGEAMPLSKEESLNVQQLCDNVRASLPELKDAVDLIAAALLNRDPEADVGFKMRASHFFKRCMQFSGPLMAKGVEDTLMYTYSRFIAHNEVGDAPHAFGMAVADFHKKMISRQRQFPLSLNASSTHDTKRGEDVRARLAVLSDLPEFWFEHVKEWRKLNAPLKQEGGPDANDEYFIYQILLGTYPMPGVKDPGYSDRLREYLQKALREAKRHSNWTRPNDAYESATQQFAQNLLDKIKPFWKSFRKVHQAVADYGVVNSLVQQVLKFTCPGVPDIYQGCEGWDLSFVDPDNRRNVPFNLFREQLDTLSEQQGTKRLVRELWRNRFDGRIKTWLVHELLQLRQREAKLFTSGEYLSVAVQGEYRDNVMAYARKHENSWLIIVLPLHSGELCSQQGRVFTRINWKDTRIVVPREITGTWKHAILPVSGRVRSKILVGELFHSLPFAILSMKSGDKSRSAGVLMHISSLPSHFGVGDLGPEAYRFVNSLHKAGQMYWQLLPVNPVEGGQGYSPYSAVSSRAGNTWLISPELLAGDGLLSMDEMQEYHLPQLATADFEGAGRVRKELFEKAWSKFSSLEKDKLRDEFLTFCERQKGWLDDFALYTFLKESQDGKPWYEWEDAFKQRSVSAMEAFTNGNKAALAKIKWLQFVFDRQWHQLKAYCNQRGLRLIGDLPFYVSYDSSDVWAEKEIFALDSDGKRTGIAGVPPDAFSDDGQLWGMPVFKWDELKKNGYRWWIERLRKNKEMFNLIRLDHFRAFSAYWEVPADEQTARNGQWKEGPGTDFFNTVIKELGALPLLAEDLGEIDEPVYKLRDKFSFPGMKILQFAFGDDFPASDYLPHQYTTRCFAYTGTHDNNTVRGWYRQEAGEETRANLAKYAGMPVTEENVHQVVATLAYASVAQTVIVPVQDMIGLDESARMNKPSSTDGNWKWRMLPFQLGESVLKELKTKTWLYNR